MSNQRRKGRTSSDAEVSQADLVRMAIVAGWIGWVVGAFWACFHRNLDLTAGAQVVATLVVAIAFTTALIGGIQDLEAEARTTRWAGGLLIALIALGCLAGLDPTEDALRRIVVGGAAFSGVLVAISAGVIAARSRDPRR